MMANRFPYTLRVFRAADGRWGWLVLRQRTSLVEWQFQIEDVIAGSADCFDTAEQAAADAEATLGANVDRDPQQWKLWTK